MLQKVILLTLLFTAVLSDKLALAVTIKSIQDCSLNSLNCQGLNNEFNLISVNSQEQIQSLLQSGYKLLNNREYQQAIQVFQNTLQLAQQTGEANTEPQIRLALAMAYQMAGDFIKALETHEENLERVRQQNNLYLKLSLEPYILRAISHNYRFQKDYIKAIERLREALALIENLQRESNSDPGLQSIFATTQATILTELGMNLSLKGDFLEAETALKSALIQTENSQKLQQEKLGIPLTVKDYEFEITANRWLQEVLVNLNKPQEALELSEKSRARAFKDLLVNRLNLSTQSPHDSDSANLEKIKKIAQTQKSTLVQYTITYDDLWVSYGNYPNPKVTNLLIWVIQPTGEIRFRQIKLRDQEISLWESVRKTREAVTKRNSRKVVADRQLQELYQFLIEPIAEFLPANPNDAVIFIPQDFLFLVPFPALQDRTGKHLIEKHTILTSPSIQVLDLTHTQQQKLQNTVNGVLIVGNPTMPEKLSPLPGAEQEVKSIAPLFSAQPLLGDQATKEAVLQRINQAQIVHLATHGLLDRSDSGLLGSLVFAPTPQDAGFLTVREIMSLKLNAELVVLSACHTGRGLITGDGVVGLSRSFIAAGVPSVIVSLWAVPDAPTATLMVSFYQHLKNGLDKAQALRQAMLAMLKNASNPVEWAAFTLIGEADISPSLQAVSGDSAINNNQATQPNHYYTTFPLPSPVIYYDESPSTLVSGEVDISFTTSLTIEDLIQFYRQAFNQKGLTEVQENTKIEPNSGQIIFEGSPNGKKIVVQVSAPFNNNQRTVSVRFDH